MSPEGRARHRVGPVRRAEPRSGAPGLDADVVVVGAGPAGSTVAGLLAERGWAVRLLDRARFPRPKPCGEFVNPGAVELLECLGVLAPVLDRRPAILRGWTIRTAAGARAVATFGAGTRGIGLPRAELDHVLVRAAVERGAVLEEGVRASGVAPLPGGGARVEVRDAEGAPGTRTGTVVVGADGLRSVVSRSLDAYRRPPRIRKLSLTVRLRGEGPRRERGLLVLGGPRTVGLAPVGSDGTLWNATVVTRSEVEGREVAGDPEAFVLGAVRDAGIRWRRPPELVGGPWASGPFDWPTRRRVGPSVLLVGDAAGYFDPLTGQGIRRALRSAVLAAAAIDRALREGGESEAALAEYDRTLRRELAPGRRVQRLVEAVVSRSRLRACMIGRLGAAPSAADTLVGVTGDVTPVRTLLRPRFWLPLLTAR